MSSSQRKSEIYTEFWLGDHKIIRAFRRRWDNIKMGDGEVQCGGGE
jgi:hypothetical protein